MIRTHNCGELARGNIGMDVVLCGWIDSRRDHGDIIFMDLRDKHGITQIVFDPQKDRGTHAAAHDLRNQFCVSIRGKVAARPEGTVNPRISTGEVEIEVTGVDVLSTSDTPPFEITDDIQVAEELRLKYRYLDLRRPEMQKKIRVKHDMYRMIWDYLDKEGFVSVETPMLTRSTPEGARDYLVPSRVQRGHFYALPQSPQIFKQLLMVAGIERYFQIVRCFRDEDLRADRQPEFTQLDMEMSFVRQDDILEVCEGLMKEMFREIAGIDIEIPFRRLDYNEALTRYGSDKPDTRFGVLLSDLTETAAGSDFKVFEGVISSGGRIMGLAAPGYGGISRKEIDELTAFAGEYGAKGLAYFKVEEEGLSSPVAKFFTEEHLSAFRENTGARTGDMIFVVADNRETACGALGALRLKIGREKGLIDTSRPDLFWVVDFPLFKYNHDEKRWVSEHHPFTMCREEDIELMEKGELSKVRSLSYDMVLNGNEIASGSIRIHDRHIQESVFRALGIGEEECCRKFGFLLEAFRYGPPPHGGIAFGLDRLTTIFTGDPSIREVIPFPKTQKGMCLLSGAPSEVDGLQLRELGIKMRRSEKDTSGV